MGYFNRDDRGGKRFGGKRNFGGNRSFGGGNQGKPFMHKATCAECGKEAEVPFKPVPGRAVFCSDCFEKRGNRPEGGFRERPQFNKPSFEKNNNGGNNAQLLEKINQLNTKLDQILQALQPKEVKTEKSEASVPGKKVKAKAAKKPAKKKAKK